MHSFEIKFEVQFKKNTSLSKFIIRKRELNEPGSFQNIEIVHSRNKIDH
jgi:hypothetical protein